MKILLTILCGLMILLSGGCVVAIGGSGLNMIVLLNLLIIVPNILMILAMYGLSTPMRPVFILLAIADLVIALLVGGLTIMYSAGDGQVFGFGLLISGAFLLKAFLTWSASRQLAQGRSDV